ncbi:hypothetical protein BDW75DRAFT_224150 [Aspergillus navahoensis]
MCADPALTMYWRGWQVCLHQFLARVCAGEEPQVPVSRRGDPVLSDSNEHASEQPRPVTILRYPHTGNPVELPCTDGALLHCAETETRSSLHHVQESRQPGSRFHPNEMLVGSIESKAVPAPILSEGVKNCSCRGAQVDPMLPSLCPVKQPFIPHGSFQLLPAPGESIHFLDLPDETYQHFVDEVSGIYDTVNVQNRYLLAIKFIPQRIGPLYPLHSVSKRLGSRWTSI